jgi:DNA polymerase-3 subunit gamma/tau
MVGQAHVVQMLDNALTQKRLHHAYLFTGTRGVGKTTFARILTKCLNCETGITSKPCGTCHACQAIDAGQFIDLYEVDAASRTKVEETRELLENVAYLPTQGRYKVYLIDEVHMLSQHSFNALLKTLEEPPAHAKFILATTDPKRLPATILSRCLQFHLKQIPLEAIASHLCHVCDEENIPYEKESMTNLAKAAKGSMRDALSLLDQAIAYSNQHITSKAVYDMLGCVAQQDLYPLLQALAERDGAQLFKEIAKIAEYAPDFEHLLAELIQLLHHIALTQITPDALSIEAPLAELATRFTPEEVQLYYQIALLGKRDLAFSSNLQQGFEMTMLRMLAFQSDDRAGNNHSEDLDCFATKNVARNDDKKSITPSEVHTKPVILSETKCNEGSVHAAPPAMADSFPDMHPGQDGNGVKETTWRDLLKNLALSGMAQALAANCTLVSMTENKIVLALFENHKPMLNKKLQDRIAEALTTHFKRPITLEIILTQETVLTPMKQVENEQRERLAQATESIMQDPRIKKLVDMYDATIEVSLLK